MRSLSQHLYLPPKCPTLTADAELGPVPLDNVVDEEAVLVLVEDEEVALVLAEDEEVVLVLVEDEVDVVVIEAVEDIVALVMLGA